METNIRIISTPVSRKEVEVIAAASYGEMSKAVVDIEKQIIAVGGELHADAERLLLEAGSQQQDIWGINLYPHHPQADWIEFDSMINIRPRQGNRSRSVEDSNTRQKIIDTVSRLIT